MERHVSYLSGENCQVHFSNFRDQSKSMRKKKFYGELMSAIYQEKEITNYSNFPTKCMILCKRSKICMQGNICMESCACQLFIRRRRGHTAVCRIMKKNGWDASGGGATSYFSAIVLQTNKNWEKQRVSFQHRKGKENEFGRLPFGSVTSNDRIQPAEFELPPISWNLNYTNSINCL